MSVEQSQQQSTKLSGVAQDVSRASRDDRAECLTTPRLILLGALLARKASVIPRIGSYSSFNVYLSML